MSDTITAILLGIVEGVTEFLPVSSTGHLILATRIFGYDPAQWALFNVVIQLGAILAVVLLYWRTFWKVLVDLFRFEGTAIRFLRNLLIAFIPSGVLGVLLKKKIDLLLANPVVVAWALIVGGIAILVIERMIRPRETSDDPDAEHEVADLPLGTVVGIGIAQCLAMVPGVSRSGATIMGALALGARRKTAAEFSFFLAIPTMVGATGYDLLSHWDELNSGSTTVGWNEIAIGFVVSFIVAFAVIKAFLTYVTRRGFGPFAWYRILAGAAALVWLGGH